MLISKAMQFTVLFLNSFFARSNMNKLVYSIIGVLVLLVLTFGSYVNTGASSAPIPAASGKIYYVSVNGNNANTGTSSAPFKTVQKCLNVVTAGDTCVVRQGTYNESLKLKTGGTASLPITIKCAVSKTCTVHSGNAQTLVSGNHTHYYIIDGLRFISTAVNNQATLYFGQGTVWSKDDKTMGNNGFILRNCYVEGDVKFYGHNNLVEKCELNGKNLWSNGITDGYAASYDNIYRNNVIHDYKVRSIWTVQYTDNILIEGNEVDGHIDCDGAGHPVTRCYVRNNIIHDAEIGIQIENSFDSVFEGNIIHDVQFGMLIVNYGLGPDFYADAEYRDTISNITVRNNLIYNVTSNGIYIYGASGGQIVNNTIQYPLANSGYYGAIALAKYGNFYSHDWELKNNILSSRNVSFLFASPSGGLPGLVSNYNLYDGTKFVQKIGSTFNNKTVTQWQAMGLDVNSTFANPLFVNPSAGDFHLQPNSPACTGGLDGTYMGAFPCDPVTPPEEVFYDNKNSAFVYSAGWKNVATRRAYHGSYKMTTKKGSYVTFNFTGQSFSILYKGGPAFRKMRVYVDGVLVGMINERTASSAFQLRWDYPGQLTQGRHRLKLVFVTANTTDNTYGSIDAVIVR